MLEKLEQHGYSWLRGGVESGLLRALQEEIERLIRGRPSPGVRRLLQKSEFIKEQSHRGFGLGLGSDLVPLRGILFDKASTANWNLSWHRDVTVAFPHRTDAPGFAGWCHKEGQLHVQPPRAFLEAMVTVRIHLDDTPASNGALRSIPGSHLQGRKMPSTVDEGGQVVLEAAAGDVLLMKPLLLHASSPSQTPGRRRIVHVEYVPRDELPAPQYPVSEH